MSVRRWGGISRLGPSQLKASVSRRPTFKATTVPTKQAKPAKSAPSRDPLIKSLSCNPAGRQLRQAKVGYKVHSYNQTSSVLELSPCTCRFSAGGKAYRVKRFLKTVKINPDPG